MLLDKVIGGYLDHLFEGWEPWMISLASSCATVILIISYNFLFQDESLFLRAKKFVLRNARRIPAVRNKISQEFDVSKKRMENELMAPTRNLGSIRALPQSRSAEEVLALAKKYKETESADWSKLSGAIYSGSDEITKLSTSIYPMFAWSNPLHPDVFPSVRHMESEVVRMCCTMFNGDEKTCGSMTSGGTESIFMACKAYRDYALARGIKKPVMVVPVTAHAAFEKSADYLCMGVRKIPMDSTTCQVNLRAMKKAIDGRTCMLVGSAPHFPHGIIDQIGEISALGLKYKIPVHVDSCLGGFLIPFMEKAGYPLELFDFRLEGVTSISADTHKYGYAPKGSSVILYRNHTYLHHQYSVTPDWPGGIYASPTMSGSRVGASIASAWSVMLYMGEDGYVKATKETIETTRKIKEALKKMKNIYILGDPLVSVIAVGSKDFNVYLLSDAMSARGWHLNALQFPSSIHVCITKRHTKPGVAEKFLQELQECITNIMENPPKEDTGMAAIYGLAQSIPDRTIISEMAWAYLDSCVALPGSGS
ncbi:sphingosine-1-phosphate lyase 1-like [Paramacrobiotus metropolitanus]|uniref:sphingosine-1-phosphate lyase 1-like n=1 Tax=Paramacrobiotus metropolitanus TaxID=2943436 RepID=UPI0024458F5D|nr:sphingosine-1-phosphate lyase 1-like [Paramacrobiotus metropolitanus]